MYATRKWTIKDYPLFGLLMPALFNALIIGWELSIYIGGAFWFNALTVAIGEIGLTGEIRSVSHMNQRLAEASRLGFKKCILPKGGTEKLEIPAGLTVYRVRNLREAIEIAM